MFQNEILKKSFDKAIGGGMSGSIAIFEICSNITV